jgi:hypothetical protein
MADLLSDTGSLRLRVDAVTREAAVRGPAAAPASDGRVPSGRLLVTVALDYLDRRDGERWPMVHLPVLYVSPESARSLAAGLGDVCAGTRPGFAWQSGEEAALGIQVGKPDGAAEDALLAEIGVDLSSFLSDAAGVARRPGAELALFRFPITRAALVSFAAALRSEVEARLAS